MARQLGNDQSYFGNSKLKETYKKIALVSHSKHISSIREIQGEVLVVSTDWLLTMQLCNKGYAAIYFEYGIYHWPDTELESEIYIRTNDWIYVDDIDHTLYKGVSLGKLFARDISLIILSYERLKRALSEICKKYQPDEIYFYDYRSEVGLLDLEAKQKIVLDICKERKICFVDKNDCVDGNDDEFPQKQIYGTTSVQQESYSILRSLYGKVLEVISRVMDKLPSAKDKIVIMTGGHLAQILNSERGIEGFRPVFFSSVLSKSPRAILKTLMKGGYLARDLKKSEKQVDVNRLKEIYCTYNAFWGSTQDNVNSLTRIIRKYVVNNIFSSNRIKSYCAQIESTNCFLDRHKPKRILLDSVFHPDSRIPMELSNMKDIKVDYIWHGFWQHIVYFDALGGDPRCKVLVDRVYTWGEQNERWLESVKWKGEQVRVGNPFARKYLDRAINKDKEKGTKRNILVLQYTPQNTDIKGLNANQYGYFVNMVEFLNNINDFNVRVKLHPGVWKKSYYERIMKHFSLKCDIRDDGPFEKHVDWADLVIGPVQSGAFLEVLAAHKIYYPVLMYPQSKMVNVKRGKVYETLGELKKDISEKNECNQSSMLHELISDQEFPNPARSLIESLLR